MPAAATDRPDEPDAVPASEVERWTRLGRLIDSSPELDFDAIADVLAGRRPYDGIGEREGDIVLTVWQRRISEGVESLDLTAELEAAGGPWYEADANGRVFACWPGGVRRPVDERDGAGRPTDE